MRPYLVSALLLAALTCNRVFADEERKGAFDNPLRPAVSAGISYPLVLSVSLGALLPLARIDKNDLLPTTPALRIDGEVGLGGGSVAGGVYIPVGGPFVASLKAVRMRTWLWTWHEEPNRTFDGGVVELAIPSLHGGPKVGLGSFKDTEPLNGSRRSFTYVFLGAGW